MSGITRRVRIGLAATILAALPGLAFAQPAARPAGGKARMMERCDENHDGVLDRSERRAMRQLRKARLLKKFDLDGNGVLDPAERTAALRVRVEKMMGRLDTDGSGALSRAELAVRPRSVLARRFQAIDANGDRLLTRHEIVAARVIKLVPGAGGKGAGKRHGRRLPPG